MKALSKAVIAALTISALSACKGFLEPYPSAIRSEEYVLSSPTAMQGLLGA